MILSGIDIVSDILKNQKHYRWALVTNEVAITATGTRSRVHLLENDFQVTRLFSPEHGLLAIGADGEMQKNTTDRITGLPVISLYGAQLAPTAETLTDIDAVLFDIPDLGCRFYTYLWTLTHVMEACALHQKPLVVLDRPNPIGGDLEKVEGPWLDETNCSSFIGRWSIPIRHSCTLGELARYFAATRLPDLDLQVIPVSNWNRLLSATETGWKFTPTSPAIRDLETALLYPGTGLLEGIYINEGRGAERPFTQLGAPWIDGEELARAFNQMGLPGVTASANNYLPDASLYAGENCGGIRLHVHNQQVFRPVQTGLSLLRLLLATYPAEVKERNYYTAANPDGIKHLDKLTGIPNAFQQLKEGIEFPLQVQDQWQQTIAGFLLSGIPG